MKKFLPIVAAMTALFVSSCQKEADKQVEPISKDKVTVLKASVTEAETKVSADAAGKFAWQSGDAITAFDNTNNNLQFTTTNGGTDTEFTFSGEATLGTYALYPYDANHMVDDNYVIVSLPNEYTYKADETNIPMLGKIENNQASFKAIGGVLKLIIYNVPEGATILTFTATNKQISGLFVIDNASIPEPVIATADTNTADDKSVAINFTRQANMVFYIPLPTGTIDGFTLAFNDANSTTKTVTASFNVGRNKIINAPALVIGSVTVPDATLSNDNISDASLGTSYPDAPVEYTNSYGTWGLAAITPNKTTTYLQIRNNSTSYVQLPTFSNNISSITLHGVVNGSENKYTGSIYFRSEANNSGANIATGTASSAKEDVTLTIPSGYKTGFIMSSAACLMTAITVSFSAGASYTIPVIETPNGTSQTISAGALEGSISGIVLSNPLDNQGISVSSDVDWLDAAFTEGDYLGAGAKLTATAKSYNHESSARTATITLKATGAAAKTVTFKQNPSIVGKPTITAEPGNKTFTVSWTGDPKVQSYVAYFSDTELTNPSEGTSLSIANEGTAYTATPSAATLNNGTTYYIYVKAASLTETYAGKYIIADEWAEASATPIGINGSVENPVSMADVVAAIDNLGDNETTTDFYYVGGTVSVASTGIWSGKLTFSFTDGTNTIKAYNCYNLNGTSFSTKDDVAVGDNVVVYGNLEKYVKNNEVTYEVVNGQLAKLESGSGNKINQVLFHETFGDNSGSARDWNNSYSVKSGVSSVYSGITGYTVTNAKQGKNTTGSKQSGLNQSTAGTDAVLIIGPLAVDAAENMVLTYQWKAGSTKATYSTKLYYATSANGSYTEVSGTGSGATSFVTRTYDLPQAAQVSTLYLKIVWNTSNTQAIIDEVNLQGYF